MKLEEEMKLNEEERIEKAKRRALKIEQEKRAKEREEEEAKFLEEKIAAELKFKERESSIQLRENRIAKKCEKLETCLDHQAKNEKAQSGRDQEFKKMIQSENR